MLERELPNLKVAVNNAPMENDDDDPMDMDDQKTDVPEAVPSNRADSCRVRPTDEATKGCRDDEASLDSRTEELYRSLGIDPGRLPVAARLNIVHVRGVTEMSTEDILDYFKEYSPLSVDWVNDYSCNVVWKEAKDAAQALLGLTRPVVIKGVAPTPREATETPQQKSGKSPLVRPSRENAAGGDAKEEVVVMSEDDPSDDDPDPSMDSTVTSGPTEELDISEVDVPVPPGRWRRGVPHSKANMLLLRFSNKYDKKTSGAEKRSEYYRKYGNPNYRGMTGLISKSRKRKMREELKGASASPKSDGELEDDEEDKSRQKEPKRMRMKMYADEEEEKIRKKKIGRRRANVGTPTPPTPWSTPGNSPTSDEDPLLGGSSVWDRLSGGRPTVRPRYMEHERSRSPDELLDARPHRGGYVDLDDPRLRDDYDEWEDGGPYGDNPLQWAEYTEEEDDIGRSRGGRSLPSRLGPVSGGDLRSKLEALRRSRKTSSEKVAPLRISVVNDTD